MERSRSDVYQRTIDEQNQKLEKYQTKLRGDRFMLCKVLCYYLLLFLLVFVVFGLYNKILSCYTLSTFLLYAALRCIFQTVNTSCVNS